MFVVFSYLLKSACSWLWIVKQATTCVVVYLTRSNFPNVVICSSSRCFSGDMYFSFVISIDCIDYSSISADGLLECSRVLFEAAIVLFSTILFQTKSLGASAVFWVVLVFFEAVLSGSIAEFLCCQKDFALTYCSEL